LVKIEEMRLPAMCFAGNTVVEEAPTAWYIDRARTVFISPAEGGDSGN
jgi:hypothetical protein